MESTRRSYINRMNKMDVSQEHLTIQEVSGLLQIPKSTIRYWEKELEGLICPYRTAGGQRRYSCADIDRLSQIDAQRKAGLSLVQIKRRLVEKEPHPGIHHQIDIDRFTEQVVGAVRREILRYFNQPR